jgi:hypothetical protein
VLADPPTVPERLCHEVSDPADDRGDTMDTILSDERDPNVTGRRWRSRGRPPKFKDPLAGRNRLADTRIVAGRGQRRLEIGDDAPVARVNLTEPGVWEIVVSGRLEALLIHLPGGPNTLTITATAGTEVGLLRLWGSRDDVTQLTLELECPTPRNGQELWIGFLA